VIDKIRLEILEYNYWEHFKKAKDLFLILELSDPKRLELEKELNSQIEVINQIKQNN